LFKSTSAGPRQTVLERRTRPKSVIRDRQKTTHTEVHSKEYRHEKQRALMYRIIVSHQLGSINHETSFQLDGAERICFRKAFIHCLLKEAAQVLALSKEHP
jgi:hypothetical protein